MQMATVIHYSQLLQHHRHSTWNEYLGCHSSQDFLPLHHDVETSTIQNLADGLHANSSFLPTSIHRQKRPVNSTSV
jgi:hypothetical protein